MDFLNDSEEYTQSPYWKLVLIGLIDAAIVIFAPIPLGLYERFMGTFWLWIPLCTFAVYRVVALLLFGRTFGMAVCKSQLLNGELEQLNMVEKAFAGIFILYRGTEYYEVK